MKMIGKIFIACGIAGVVLLFGLLWNRVDSLQQAINLLNHAVVGVSWTVNENILNRLEKQQMMIDQQRNEIDRINSLNNRRCPWQSALHNPNLVNKYWIHISIIKKESSGEWQANNWNDIYNEEYYDFPDDAIIYLKTLEPLSESSTYLINMGISNNSTDSRVSEYQQSVFEYPQDAINYLEFINYCGQAEKDWERSNQ